MSRHSNKRQVLTASKSVARIELHASAAVIAVIIEMVDAYLNEENRPFIIAVQIHSTCRDMRYVFDGSSG
jgi:hypothetical protein